jgi:hypothetical protein
VSDHVLRQRKTRKQDPRWSTSDEAYERSRPSEPTLAQRVIALLQEAPMTCDEVQALIGGIHQSVSPVFTKLAQDGVIEPTGDTRQTRSGRAAKVMRIALPKPAELPQEPQPCADSLFPMQSNERRML